MISKRTACVAAITVVLGLVSACSDTKTSSPETVATDRAESITLPPTTPAPTTVAPTLAPTTTAAPLPFLRSDGAGPFDFGDTEAEVFTGMPLASVVSDDLFTDPDPALSFAYPHGRTVCWDDGSGALLCVLFGGADALHLTFVGWNYGSPAGLGLLYSASGATANILVSAVPSMPPIEGACYTWTNVGLDGIDLELNTNTDEWFGVNDSGTGVWIPTVPVPANSTVTLMSAGEQMYPLEGADC